MSNHGRGNLSVVPQVGTAVDLAERKELLEPMEARIILLPIQSGILKHDKRLDAPAILGGSFLWMIKEDAVRDADPPIIMPFFEN
jgi:hypothetical protein